MSREIKIGLLAIVSIFCAIWGYKFVKGQNLFENTKTFITTFSDVTALPESADVLLNGFKVGQVVAIKLNKENVKMMDVEVRVDGSLPIPKDAFLLMKSEGLVGGKILNLVFDKPCNGSECAESGQKLEGKVIGLLGSMVSSEEIDSYVSEATGSLQGLIKSLGEEGSEGKINDIVRNIDDVVDGVNKLTASTNQLIITSDKNIQMTLIHIEQISRNLAANNQNITETLNNLNKLTTDLAQSKIKETVANTDKLIANTNTTMSTLDNTVKSMQKTIDDLNKITTGINQGKGSLGMLIQDKGLYNNLQETSSQISYLLQDLRLNPKRYVNLSLIGRKNKAYVPHEADPLFEENKR